MPLFQVGKEFDALLIDTSAPSSSDPVFDTVSSDTTNVRIADARFEMLDYGLYGISPWAKFVF